ncbi:MAG: DUF4258 domain-containing protein [Pyrinomonadaceae bacterium]|nr:DUF4258 domain-containing protein [Pyrinomonadaceae bacterium]
MFEDIRDKIRSLVRSLNYVMTIHGEEEMNNDRLSIFDVEAALLSGEIVEHQRDEGTRESKYLVAGRTIDGDEIILVTKIGITGKLIIITVFREESGYEN